MAAPVSAQNYLLGVLRFSAPLADFLRARSSRSPDPLRRPIAQRDPEDMAPPQGAHHELDEHGELVLESFRAGTYISLPTGGG